MPLIAIQNESKGTPAQVEKPGRSYRLASPQNQQWRLPVGRVLFLFLVLSCLGLSATAEARGLPVQEGILNFGKVSEHLYRGAQPDTNGILTLKRLGVKLIVNLRMPGDSWKEEEAIALANGILYTNFPMNGLGRPNTSQVRELLSLLDKSPDPIFVHCRHGCDRTGMIVACYRLQHDRWSIDGALREARHYGISWLEFLMKGFVKNFGRELKAEKVELRQARAN